MIACPLCHEVDSKVLDTRSSGAGIRRRRQCLRCAHRFTTFERLERRLPLVVKKDGSRQPFDRDKVMAGLELACRKRPVSAAQLEEAVVGIERELSGNGAEVSSEDIGRQVMRALRDLDPIAYVRFASVYMELDSPEDFLALVQPLVDEVGRAGPALLREGQG